MVKTVVIDARAHMLGRLASIVAKQILLGYHVVVCRAEQLTLSGGLTRQKMKYDRFLRKRMLTNPQHGPIHFRAPSRIFWRTVRGMVPHKTARGEAALERMKVFEGVPAPYDKVKRMVVPDALQPLRLQKGHKFCQLGDLSTSVGWKHQNTMKELEDKRKAKSTAFFEAKRRMIALRSKAIAQVEAGKA
ncbi:ribosomal protein L13a component of cytosolic 80S ribosome and 60S large subunit [Dunaliella salina]|uniref:Ribosomal protein L13a component of cytosolic 80S ribosome and 60S large subunit n=1 Tax=Dunaliella salina TaxID=3046 RepID=A0ABQ7GBA4_DUNSA|nr:ribosomal protein L13a component of cytosolic 80S ribosome and 60S large subunit [Dunaliella salina]|eukprot:KAF5831881.1 ribosomal protein L13a component of cytosolic 80S ribosome and 60S large subunit [Dunaliella salina]